MTVPAPARTRRVSWDVLRALAVLLVVLQHATFGRTWNHPELGPPPFLMDYQAGAATLIVISAYFVCVTVRRGRRRDFLRNRLSRLLPAFVVAAVGTWLVLRFAAPDDWIHRPGLGDLLGNLLLIPNWVPGVGYVDASYWTLPLQVTAFVVAAALTLGGWMRGRRMVVLVWVSIVVPVLLLPLAKTGVVGFVFQGVPLHRVHYLALGVGVWLWSIRRISGPHLAVLLAAGVVAHQLHTGDVRSTQLFGLLLLAVCAAARGPDWDVAPLRPLLPALRWVAGISFGIYLVNQELGYLVARWLHDLGFGATTQVIVVVASAIVLGWLLTVVVERPAQAALQSRPAKRPEVPADRGAHIAAEGGSDAARLSLRR
jgi:peptidoglycan/LPS O-acetylase OafA/YrhL